MITLTKWRNLVGEIAGMDEGDPRVHEVMLESKDWRKCAISERLDLDGYTELTASTTTILEHITEKACNLGMEFHLRVKYHRYDEALDVIRQIEELESVIIED